MNPLMIEKTTDFESVTALSVNVNKVALLRNTRHLGIPSVLQAARCVIAAGAQGITVHPRPDERHIRRHDVFELAELLQHYPYLEYNIEGNPFHNLMDYLRQIRPQQVTLVPDSADQFTSDHGWSFPRDIERLRPVIDEAKALGVRVSLFMDPSPEMMGYARELGADRVELYTEAFARAYGQADESVVLGLYRAAADAARAVGLGVNAGHDLNRANLTAFLQAIPSIKEVSIGHALIADALELGYEQTVKAYLHCIQKAY